MARRNPHTEYKYLKNIDPDHLEVHDLDNEKTGSNQCQIDEIIAANNARYLTEAHNEIQLVSWLNVNPHYDGCRYCLPHLHRK